MPATNENTKQIKSRQRVAQHGEVFTNPREVNAMLDLVRDESFRLDSRFLEPACGDGNFLIEILRRKLSLLKDIKSPTEWEFQSLIAVGSCYGIELLEDNAEACRLRLFTEVREQMGKKRCTQGYEESLRYMLRKNIVCGDALTYRTAGGKPITFCEWTPIAGSMQFSRRDFQFDFLVNQTHQYSLFDEQGEAQSFDEPVKSYPPIHYTQLYRYEEQDTHSI
ncbi:MAG: SAM-dependent DNA methyltransferase [Bacteroidales bacterium]|nr:SAM-dependent DNA methyltransferase [Bacteroidales bacterium]